MTEFIITFRECLEATLIVGIVYTFLIKTGMQRQIKYLWSGVASAIIASIAVALILQFMFSNIQNEVMQALFEGIFMYITAALLLYVVFWLSKSISNRKKLEELASISSASSKWGIFLLIFFAILREGFETVIFLHGGAIIGEGQFSYLGFSLGILIACLIGYLIFSQGKKLNLKPFFAVTTFFLVLFSAGMSGYATHEIEEYILKRKLAPIKLKIEPINKKITKELDTFNKLTTNPTSCDTIKKWYQEKKSLENQISEIKKKFEENIIRSRPWNILKPIVIIEETIDRCGQVHIIKTKKSHILHDKGSIGVFLKGFFGYNSNPNWIELSIWIITLIFGLSIWKKFYLKSWN